MMSYTESNHLTVKKLFAAYGVYMALLILLIVASFITPDLFDEETLAVLFRQSAQLGIIAIGQTMVMLVAGLDLSVGGVIVMTSMVVAEVSNGRDELIPLSIFVALILGSLIGLCNGLLITKRKSTSAGSDTGNAVFGTRSTTSIHQRSAKWLCPGSTGCCKPVLGISIHPFVGLVCTKRSFLSFVEDDAFGRRIYAVGSNEEAARLSGLSVHRVKIAVYILASCLAVISGVILTGYVGYVDRFIATGLDLDSVAAAVVGGTAFYGGKGGLLGTIAGVLIIQILSTMVVLLGLDAQTQFIIKGLVILAAVSLYGLAQRQA